MCEVEAASTKFLHIFRICVFFTYVSFIFFYVRDLYDVPFFLIFSKDRGRRRRRRRG